MQKLKLPAFYLLATLALLTPTVRAEYLKSTATIAFHGTSTLHGFEGEVTTKPFSADLHKDPATGKQLISATAIVTVAEMSTHGKKRDKNMFKMFNAEDFSLIVGVLENAPLPEDGSTKTTLRLKIRDVEQNIAATLSDWKRDGDLVSCKMTFSVSLKAFGLKGPSVMGLIRVGDTVDIECTLQGTAE